MTWYTCTLDQDRQETTADRYPRPFAEWGEKAGVRKPAIKFDLGTNRRVYPLQLITVRGHPLVHKLGDHALDRLGAHQLLSYLRGVDAVASDVIIPAVGALGRVPEKFGISPQAGRDSRLIETDEGYRSWTAIELATTVIDGLGVRYVGPNRPKFLGCYEEIGHGLPESLSEHLLVQFACLFEICESPVLWRSSTDEQIAAPVRQVTQYHAADEQPHSVYFSYVLRRLWTCWSRDQRSILGPLFARLLRLILEPDFARTILWLEDIGLCPDDADRVIRDCFASSLVDAAIRADAEAVLRLLRQIGVFDNDSSRHALARHHLIN